MNHYRDTNAPVTWTTRCDRCVRFITGLFPAAECFGCVQAAQAVWPGVGPIRGDVSGT